MDQGIHNWLLYSGKSSNNEDSVVINIILGELQYYLGKITLFKNGEGPVNTIGESHRNIQSSK